MALSYRVDDAFGAAIRIAYGDRDGGDEDGRNGARSALMSGGCCAAKTTPSNETFALRVLQRPLRGQPCRFDESESAMSAVHAAEAATMVN